MGEKYIVPKFYNFGKFAVMLNCQTKNLSLLYHRSYVSPLTKNMVEKLQSVQTVRVCYKACIPPTPIGLYFPLSNTNSLLLLHIYTRSPI